MSEWVEWHGGEQPVADDVVVEVRLRNGYTEFPVAAGDLRWIHLNSGGDILAYRIVSQLSELDRLRKENARLREALQRAIPYIATAMVGCNGDKCREPWCYSCCGEEATRKAAQEGLLADIRALAAQEEA